MDKEIVINKPCKHSFDYYIDFWTSKVYKGELKGKLIIEIDINAACRIPSLWGVEWNDWEKIWDYYLQSEKFIIVPYTPTMDDWLAWAIGLDEHGVQRINQMVVKFAQRYSMFYQEMDYHVFNRLNHDIESRLVHERPTTDPIRFGYMGRDLWLSNIVEVLFRDMLRGEGEDNLIKKLYID